MDFIPVSSDDWAEPPILRGKPRKRLLQASWKERKKAEGYCHNCYRMKAGEDGGSLVLCGTCRREKRKREDNRRKGKPTVFKPRPARMEPELRRYLKATPAELKLSKKVPMRESLERVERLLKLASGIRAERPSL